MELTKAIRVRILELMKINNVKAGRLALMCGLYPSTIRRFLKEENRKIKIETITLIAQAFNMSLKEFFDSDIFNEVEVKD